MYNIKEERPIKHFYTCKTKRKSSQYNTDTHVKHKGRTANITLLHM